MDIIQILSLKWRPSWISRFPTDINVLSYLHCIAGTLKHGHRHQDHVSIYPRSQFMDIIWKISYKWWPSWISRWPTYLCIFLCHHWIAGTLKHGYRHQNHVCICLWNKVMSQNMIFPILLTANLDNTYIIKTSISL